jgi:hypothetical protein
MLIIAHQVKEGYTGCCTSPPNRHKDILFINIFIRIHLNSYSNLIIIKWNVRIVLHILHGTTRANALYSPHAPRSSVVIYSQVIFRSYSGHVQVIFRLYSGYIQVIFRLYSGYIQVIFRLYSGHIQVIFRLYSGYIQVIFRLYSGYIQVIFRLYLGYIQVIFRSYSGYI